MKLKYCYIPVVFLTLLTAVAARADEVRLSYDGKTLNADQVIADEGRASDEIMVILHGTLGHKDMEIIQTLQSFLAEIGRDSLAINLSLDVDDRHGFFDCDLPHSHRANDAIEELGVWVNWIRTSGTKKISLLGHSRGANQAAKYVLTGDTPISKLVLLAPPARDSSLDASELRPLASMKEDDWLADVNFLHCEAAKVQVASYLSYLGSDANTDTVTLLADIEVPTLVISGSDDQVSSGLGARMTEAVSDSVSHVEIDGAGHFFRDLYLYDVVDAIDSFLSRDGQ